MMEIFWNGWLVALSVAVGIAGSYTALSHIQRMRQGGGRAATVWMLAGGVSLGLAVWAMHFIGMLAFHLDIPVVYDTGLTLLSILPAVAAALFAFSRLRTAQPGSGRLAAGCIGMGVGIAAMHYLGMAAMQITPGIVYDPLMLAVTLGMAVLAGCAVPLAVQMGETSRLPAWLRNVPGGAMMGLGLAGMHYAGMSGIGFEAGSICSTGDGQIDSAVLAMYVTGGVFLLLGAGIFASLFEQRVARQNQQNLGRVQQAHASAMNMAAELQLVLDSVSQGVAIADINLHITYVNGAFEQITGYSEDQVLGRGIDLLQLGESSPDSLALLRETIKQTGIFHREMLHYRRDGSAFWDEISINPVYDAAGQLLRFVIVLRDVSARRAIEQSNREFKATLDQTRDCVFMFDAQTLLFFYVNQGAQQQVGYTLEEMLQMRPYEIKPDIDEAHFRMMIELLLNGELDILTFETVHQHKNGTRVPVEINLQLVRVQGERSRFVAIVRDITERKQTELELERHRDHLQELVDARTQALCDSEANAQRALAALMHQKFVLDQHAIVAFTDVQGRIKYANDKFCEISGYGREELLGQDHQMLNSGMHPHGFFKGMYRTVAGGEVWHGEICNRAKDGGLYWVDTTIAPFLGEDGRPQEYIAIRTDITKRKRAEDAANAANLAKSEFLANMSHEIRTPMNGVVGMLDIMLESRLDRDQRRRVETIRKSALVLLNILNDILDFSKIEAGKLVIENIPTPLRELVESVAQQLPVVLSGRNVDLHVFVSPELPHLMLSDPVRLRQILFNLMGNALKFSAGKDGRRARVVVSAELNNLRGGRKSLHLCISDNGIGMSPETQAQLFRNFTQADESTTRRFGGTGLGLSITKRLVELMGGQIRVRSTLDKGSEFIVEMPLEAAQPDGLTGAVDLSGLRVLMVGRDPFYYGFVSAYLRAAGAEVERGEPEKIAEQSEGTIVVLDPDSVEFGISGVPTVQLIRGSSSVGDSKAVMVSVNPLIYGELLQAVAIASGRMCARDVALQGEHRIRARTEVPTVEAAAAAGRLILLAEDNETNREVITEQLRLLGHASEAAVDGREALEMWRSGRYALLLTDCHMPELDGFQLTAAIRAEQTVDCRFTVIAVTANAMQGEAQRCLDCGMDDYLSKPLRLNELGAMLEKWLPHQVEVKQRTLESQPASAVVWDATMLTKMVGDNPELHLRLLERFMDAAQQQLEEIAALVQSGDAAAVKEVAHKLKSAARTVGAMSLGELCQSLELAGKAGDIVAINTLAAGLKTALNEVSEQIGESCT